MSTAPSNALAGIEDEIRLLRESQNALRAAVAAAVHGRDATAADLAAVRTRLTAKTDEALPHDEEIRKRIGTAIESSFATALRALTTRWDEIVKLLETACRRVEAALKEAEAKVRRLRDAPSISARQDHAG